MNVITSTSAISRTTASPRTRRQRRPVISRHRASATQGSVSTNTVPTRAETYSAGFARADQGVVHDRSQNPANPHPTKRRALAWRGYAAASYHAIRHAHCQIKSLTPVDLATHLARAIDVHCGGAGGYGRDDLPNKARFDAFRWQLGLTRLIRPMACCGQGAHHASLTAPGYRAMAEPCSAS